MKKMCVLMLCLGVLLLTACQKNEDVQTLEKESGISFKKLGDPRNPAEFMSPEEIKIVQEAFNDMQGKKFENPVVRGTNPLTKGSANQWDENLYLLEDISPIVDIDGDDWLYIKVLIIYDEAAMTFDAKVNYRLGTGSAFKLGYESKGNINAYIAGDEINGFNRILIGDCSFDIELKNNPDYTMAKVYFPYVMQWDQRVGYEEGCDLIINQRSIRIQYF